MHIMHSGALASKCLHTKLSAMSLSFTDSHLDCSPIKECLNLKYTEYSFQYMIFIYLFSDVKQHYISLFLPFPDVSSQTINKISQCFCRVLNYLQI